MKTQKNIISSGYYYIKPAANHILTVGRGIIKDSYTAILELVKNAYDADAENVAIKLIYNDDELTISIIDDGHGMSYDTVINKWMVPSTANKVKQKRSLGKKRPLQGRKGIGRYAASILGENLVLITTDKETLVTTKLSIDWRDFLSDSKYLEDVNILIESYKDPISIHGTELHVTGDKKWSDSDLDLLILSLKRMLSPYDEIDNDFNISLKIQCDESERFQDYEDIIKPLPILEYFHYRVFGTVKLLGIVDKKRDGFIANLTLENNRLKEPTSTPLIKEIFLQDGRAYCGDIDIDIRAFDLDSDIIIKDDRLSQEEAKKQLKELPGIAVIRDGFRVRPYGERNIDWLGLNQRRFNNPTMCLSVNQVAGFVTVLQEDESHLEEKATREGFKEDEHYEGLKEYIISSLSNLENLRYNFRRLNNPGGKKQKSITEKIGSISNYSKLNDRIDNLFSISNVSAEVVSKVKGIISEETKEKDVQLEEIKKTIAIYEGQVTLGKIMTVVMHEGRKPLNALKQHPKFISVWCKEFLELIEKEYATKNEVMINLTEKITDRLNDNKNQAEVFVNIFKKLEPLANSKRPPLKEFSLVKPIKDAFKLFEAEIIEHEIEYIVDGDLDAIFIGWEVDFYIVFANLIENSIFWLNNVNKKKISVNISEEDSSILIEYFDNGKGIDDEKIDTQNIFDPGYSTKIVGDITGTGLGLSIAGEALERNNASIKAVSNLDGANFIIKIIKNI